MTKVIIITRHEFLVTLSRTGYRIFTVLPLLIGLAVLVGVLVFQSITQDKPVEEIAIGYVDETGLFTSFLQQGNVTFKPFTNQERATQALLDGDVGDLYVIPNDYVERGVIVQVKERQPGISLDEKAYTSLRDFLLDNLLSEKLPDNLIDRSRNPVSLATVEVDAMGNPVEEPFRIGRFIFFLALGIMVIMSVMTTSGYLLQDLGEEKENRIMEVLLSSVTPNQLMLGKLFGLGLAGLTQVMIWLVCGVILFVLFQNTVSGIPSIELPPPGSILLGLLYFVLSYAFFGSLMGALAAVSTTQREAQQMTFIVVLPAIIPMWLQQSLLEHPDALTAKILSFIPFTAPLSSMVRLAMGAMSPLDLLVSLGLLLLEASLVVLLTLRLFKTYLLMYGRKPRIREILTTIARG